MKCIMQTLGHKVEYRSSSLWLLMLLLQCSKDSQMDREAHRVTPDPLLLLRRSCMKSNVLLRSAPK